MARPKFTVSEFIEAIKGTGGIKSVVAKKLGCDWSTVNNYAKRHPTIQAALIAEDESVTDLAEAKALALINSEYWPAIKYRLETKGKGRGYTTRQEITGADGEAIKLYSIVSPDDWPDNEQ